MGDLWIVTFDCNKCGWSWLGNFAHCPNCKGSDVSVIEYETSEQFAEKIQMIEELSMYDYFFISEDWEIET